MSNKKKDTNYGVQAFFYFITLIGLVLFVVGLLAAITAYFVEEVEVERFLAIGLLAYYIAGTHSLTWILIGGSALAFGFLGIIASE